MKCGVFSIGLLGVILAPAAYAESPHGFCTAAEIQYHSMVEVSQLVQRVCDAEPGSGATVRFKSSILIFPEPFFLRVPWDLSIALGLPTFLDDSTLQAWEFGGLQIGSDDTDIFRVGKSNAHAVDHPVIHWASSQCREPISLSKGITERPIVGSRRDVYFLSVQEHTIRAVGDVRALMLALIDSYTRLNCLQ